MTLGLILLTNILFSRGACTVVYLKAKAVVSNTEIYINGAIIQVLKIASLKIIVVPFEADSRIAWLCNQLSRPYLGMGKGK
jgi:hypothetical protein